MALVAFCCRFKSLHRVLGNPCELQLVMWVLCGLFWTSCVLKPVTAEGCGNTSSFLLLSALKCFCCFVWTSLMRHDLNTVHTFVFHWYILNSCYEWLWKKKSGVPCYMKLQQFVRRSWEEDVWRDVDSSGMLSSCVKRIRGPFKPLPGQIILCCTETMHRC